MAQCKGYPMCGCVDGSCGDDIRHEMSYLSCVSGRKVLSQIKEETQPQYDEVKGMEVVGFIGGNRGTYQQLQLRDKAGNLYEVIGLSYSKKCRADIQVVKQISGHISRKG